jgi:hypothetical protein
VSSSILRYLWVCSRFANFNELKSKIMLDMKEQERAR